MHICLDFICELINQPQLEKQVCKNCFSRFSDSITTEQDCEQSFLFLRPVRRVDWFTSMQIFPRLGCLAAQLVRITVACARLHLAVKKDAKNARGLGRESATTPFPRSRAFIFAWLVLFSRRRSRSHYMRTWHRLVSLGKVSSYLQKTGKDCNCLQPRQRRENVEVLLHSLVLVSCCFSIISTCFLYLVVVICNTARFISLPSIPASQGDGCGQVHSQSPQFSLGYTPC